MTLWEFGEDGSVSRVKEIRLVAESQIENAIQAAPELLGMKVLIVGRQMAVGHGGRVLDQLAINERGRLVVIENKRDRTPRDVVAQVIDYAAWADQATLLEIEERYEAYVSKESDEDNSSLLDAYQEHFEMEGTSDDIREHLMIGIEQRPPHMVVVASRLDDSTERMLEFLNVSFGVPINAVLFQPFEHPNLSDSRLVGRTWLRPDESGLKDARGSRSVVNSEHQEKKKKLRQDFWDAWLKVAKPVLTDLNLPTTSMWSYVSTRINSDCPAKIQIWVLQRHAYAQIRFDNKDPALNDAYIGAMEQNRNVIEDAFGGTLEWKNESGVKATMINTPKIDVGYSTQRTADILRKLTCYTKSIYDAVKDEIPKAYDHVTRKSDNEGGLS